MTTIAIANGAGSAGKTTTAVTLAALAAKAGRRVRLVDLDPQGNATQWATDTDSYGGTIADVLTNTCKIADAETASVLWGLEVIPAAPARMEGLEARLTTVIGAEQRLRLALEAADPTDLTIIDCPGSLGLLTVAGLVAADHVITVAMPSVKELAGLPRIDQLVTDIAAAYRPQLDIAAVVPCVVPAATAGHLYSDAIDLVHQQWGHRVTPSIRRTVRVSEAYAARQPLPEYDPTGGATADYQAVYQWLTDCGILG